MPQAVENVGATLEQLSEQVRSLERRIALLEGQQEQSATIHKESVVLQRPRPPATWRGFPPVETPSGLVPTVGRAVLGIAGAYLLRALAESPSVPKLPLLLVAIVYACGWMVWAVRVHSKSPLASTMYAVTSALILSPMLWESTVRFQTLSPAVAAAITVAFVVLAISISWRKDLQLIPWVATLASVVTALALIIETHELVPLTAALLAVAMVTEAAACLGHRFTLRAFPALAADFATWLLVYVLTAETIPEGYHAAAARTIATLCLLLLAIYGTSIGVRSFALRQPITFFEVTQSVVAFALASYGVLHATHGAIARPLGAAFLIVSVICYWGTLSRFTEDSQTRNRRVSATWATALLVAGSYLLFTTSVQIVFLAVSAIAAAVLYAQTRKVSLGIHASFYLAAATALSTLPSYAANALMEDVPGAPDWRGFTVAIAAALCYLIGSRTHEDRRSRRFLWIVPAGIVSFMVAAWAVAVIVAITSSHGGPAASSLSVIRTIVICAVALGLAITGARMQRAELTWIAYTAVALGTLKLLLEDLRFGSAASLVISFVFYGSILILLPRLARAPERPS